MGKRSSAVDRDFLFTCRYVWDKAVKAKTIPAEIRKAHETATNPRERNRTWIELGIGAGTARRGCTNGRVADGSASVSTGPVQ